MGYETLIGAAAAFLTTASYIPQLKKAWQTGDTEDLSLKMLLILGSGLSLWIVYGVMRTDPVIMIANGVSVTMIGCLTYLKLQGQRGQIDDRH
jgi:MtN3 and saliva related transmembrane protein